MSGASSSDIGGKTYDTSLSDAYAKGGASASQVQAIRDREIAHQDSVRSGGNGYYSTSSGNANSLIPSSTIVDKYNGNDYNGLSYSDLISGNFGKNYITGNSLAANTSVNNAQKAMIQSNYYAKQAGNESPFSLQQITDAANGGYTGHSYNPGRSSYSYVTPYQTGGQNWISPTMRTDQAGRTVQYKGYANEPLLGSYARGVSTPQEMNYSWERTLDPLTGSYAFNPAGATAAAARDLTLALAPVSNVAKVPVLSANSTWQQRLETYKTDRAAGFAEIARAQQVYNEKIKAGDFAGAEAAHQWANQIREAMGVADQYDKITGEYIAPTGSADIPTATTTSTAPLTPDPVTQLTEMMQKAQAQLGPAPAYQPYQQQAFSYTAPNYSITANPADTSFIPTAKAKDRWQQQEQANADEAYKQYSSNYNAYLQGYNATQDAIANALSLLPYSEMTAAQKAQMEYDQAQDAKKAELDKQAAEREEYWKQKDYELDQAKYDLSASKSSGGGSSSGGGGGSSGGNNNELYQDTIDSMLDGQARFRASYLKNNSTAPHSYNYYVNKAIALAKQQGKSLSQSQINALLQQANYMSTADTAWKKSITSAAGIINQIGK